MVIDNSPQRPNKKPFSTFDSVLISKNPNMLKRMQGENRAKNIEVVRKEREKASESKKQGRKNINKQLKDIPNPFGIVIIHKDMVDRF